NVERLLAAAGSTNVVQSLEGGHLGAECYITRRYVAACRSAPIAEQVASSAQFIRRQGLEHATSDSCGKFLEQAGLIVGSHPAQDIAHLIVGETVNQVFLVIQRKVRENAAGQLARKDAEDGNVIFVRHLDQNF